MSRTPVALRAATVEDALFLADLWRDVLRRADPQDQVTDIELLVKSCEASPERRLLVADFDGQAAGAVLLVVGTVSPLNLESAIHVYMPFVAAGFRRHGIGHLLMDAAAGFAEELSIGQVTTAASTNSRAGNRFMARLGFGGQATLRVAATPMLRARLSAQLPGQNRNARPVGQVLAARRSLRRRQSVD